MTHIDVAQRNDLNEKIYKRRIWAWTMYDWANSAFATTILAVVLPVYFSQVAGASLPSATVATTYWSAGLSLSLLIIALLSPILGTISDVMRGKKRFLAVFTGLGIVTTALLVFVSTGDWVLASILGILGRIGFSGANTFYDALLPHVAREEDRDQVSARGYAMGYLGGGLLLAINIVMIQVLPGTWGARLSFLSVAVWWLVFSIPLLRHIPEPPAAAARLVSGLNIISASFTRLGETLRDIHRYRELFKYLISFLIYNDGIGTIIGVAAIYGAELGFGSVELILALLLVQFVGIPYSLIFGRLPKANEKRRPFFLAFVVFNMIALPLLGILGARLLPANISGVLPPPFPSTETHAGQGSYFAGDDLILLNGEWQTLIIPADQAGSEQDLSLLQTGQENAALDFAFNGDRIEIVYAGGPEYGILAVHLDGKPYLAPDTNEPLQVDGYSQNPRYELRLDLEAETVGEHTLSLINTGNRNPESQGNLAAISQIQVLAGRPQSNLGIILGMILILEVIGLGLSALLGPLLFTGLANSLDTRRSILLALLIYSIVAVWGFSLESVVEFWCLAWMVAVVQGGSQALSRSLYSALSPASKSGEFFGLFGVMEKFSAIIGPLLFATAGVVFGSSRPAVLSLVLLFILGGWLLTRVNVEEGKRVAKEEDSQFLESA
jgi:UMF1 family MFS transporter